MRGCVIVIAVEFVR